MAKWWLIKRGFLKEVTEPLIETQEKVLEVDDKEIIEHVMLQADQILCEFNTRLEYVLVGIKQFAKIKTEFRRMLLFEFNGNVQTHHPNRNLTLPWNGIKVVIVPWMDGAIAIPSLDKLH